MFTNMATNLNTDINVDDFVLNNLDKVKNQQVISDIIEKKTTFVNIVESLGSVLTNDNKDIRRRGVEYLSWLLSRLPSNFLSERELQFLAIFYCDRVKDHHSIIPAVLEGILSLVSMANIPEQSTNDLLHNIFQFVTCQAQLAPDRKTLYRIMKVCSESHFACLKAMGPDFVYGVIASMEGETDPQNLLLIFSFIPSMLSRLEFNHLTTDIFEVFSTYFPVDFTTMEKDGIIIRREDLADGLSCALTATDQLAVECIPLIMEKLESTLKAAKLDSYKLLQLCCKRLNASHLEPYLNSLWRILQRDLLPPMDPAIHSEALRTLSGLTETLNNSSEISLNKFLDDVIVGVRSLASKPEDSLFSPAMAVFHAICIHSPVAVRRVFMELQILCRPKNRTFTEVQALLKALTPFMLFLKVGDPAMESIASLLLESSVANNNKVQVMSFVALSTLYKELAISEKWRFAVYEAILTVFRRKSTATCSHECHNLLRLLGETNPTEFLSKVYTELENLMRSNEVTIETFLDASAAVVDIPSLRDHVIGHYSTFGRSSSQSSAALQSLLSVCQNTSDPSFVSSLYPLVDTLIGWWVHCGEESSLKPLSYLVKYVMASQTSAKQQEIVELHSNVLLPAILQKKATSEKLIILLEGLLGALRPDVEPTEKSSLHSMLIENAMSSDNDDVRESAGRLLGSFVNKSSVDNAQDLLKSVADFLNSDNGCNSGRVVALFAWVLKGALLRGLPGLERWLELWFSFLDQLPYSRETALRTKCLLQDETEFLNASCHCTIKFLFRQRLFCYLPKLAQPVPSITDQARRDNYLLTLVQLASGVPLQVLKSQEESVALVVSLAMHSEDPLVVEPALELLRALLEERCSLFADHVTSFLPVLLKLSVPPSTLHVRRRALHCIFLAGYYPTQITLPFRTDVVRALLLCLDDRKRIVRAEAVRARSRWCLVGAVGEDSIMEMT